MTKLDAALPKASAEKLLPFAHVTVGEHLRTIADLAALVPGERRTLLVAQHPGSSLGPGLLYFTYGLPQYKPPHDYTDNPLAFPVAFVFHPDLLLRLSRFYPFDTGALSTGRLGDEWRNAFDLDDVYVSEAPNRLVEYFYRTNSNYLDKVLAPPPKKLPTDCWLGRLWKLLQGPPGDEVDDRHRTIEGVSSERFDLTEDVLWMGFPDSLTDVVRRLWEKHASPAFQYYPLKTLGRESPHVLARLLAQKAKETLSGLFTPP